MIKARGGDAIEKNWSAKELHCFKEAKSMGDILVVTVTPDRFVNKGPTRPVFAEELRVEAIAALDVVDYVAINKSPTQGDSKHL